MGQSWPWLREDPDEGIAHFDRNFGLMPRKALREEYVKLGRSIDGTPLPPEGRSRVEPARLHSRRNPAVVLTPAQAEAERIELLEERLTAVEEKLASERQQRAALEARLAMLERAPRATGRRRRR